jgi:DNA-binding response OmpR family regulator
VTRRDGPILLVEDDYDDVVLIRRAFDRAGFTAPIKAVHDSADAVLYLQGKGIYADREEYPLPTLMLLDLKLPGGSGFDVLKWVRDRSGIRRLPIIVLTSSSADRDVNMAYDLGANSYVVKPLTFESLLELVKAVEMYWVALNEPPDLTK